MAMPLLLRSLASTVPVVIPPHLTSQSSAFFPSTLIVLLGCYLTLFPGMGLSCRQGFYFVYGAWMTKYLLVEGKQVNGGNGRGVARWFDNERVEDWRSGQMDGWAGIWWQFICSLINKAGLRC